MSPAAPPTSDYSSVTEITGEAVRRDAVVKMRARYAFAAEHAAGKDVLEVACGSGQGLGIVAARARRTVGGDYTQQLVIDAAKHYGSRVRFVCLDGQQLPFVNASFDVVLCYEALYYFPDADHFAAEAARVLRPGGELLIVSVNPEWPGFNPSPFSIRYHTAAELAGLLAQHGFESDIRGAFPETEGGLVSRIVGLIRRVAVGLHVMPKTMRGKRLLKRLFYGTLVPLPSELLADEARSPELRSIEAVGMPTVLYALGRRGLIASSPFRPESLTLVIPAYNEHQLIESSVTRQRDALSAQGLEFQIIVVDDGSVDGTGSVANALAERYPDLSVLRFAENRGVGAAIWAGYQAATSEWVLANAADEPLEISDLPRLFASAGDADVIVVYRRDRRANSGLRRITSVVNYWLIRLLFRVRVRDFQFVQIYRRSVLDAVRPNSSDTFMPPELLLRVLRTGARMIEVEAKFHARRAGSSSYNDPRRYVRTLKEMLAFWLELRRGRRALKEGRSA